MIRIDDILLSGSRRFPGLEEKRKKVRFAKKEMLKNVSDSDKDDKIDALIK